MEGSPVMPSINIPPTVRFSLYLLSALGSVGMAYLFAKGYAGEAETGAWAGIVAIINGIAAANTNITDKVLVEEDGHTDALGLALIALTVVVILVLLGILR
jgi:hypothetical protein